MLKADIHTHSVISHDAEDSLDLMKSYAVKNGVDILCVTDHYEIPERTEPYYLTIEPKMDDAIRNHRTDDGNFKMLYGIELGAAIYDPEFSKVLVERHDFDFVLNSLHHELYADGSSLDYYFMDFVDCDTTKMLREYFEKLYEQSRLLLFDSLAHLDYPTRYMRLKNIPFDLRKCTDEIDAILKLLVENGKALEINTQGLFSPFCDTLPNLDIIKRFRSFGGEFITVGSDSHQAEFVGRGFECGVQRAKDAGFEYITYYEKRKPQMIKID